MDDDIDQMNDVGEFHSDIKDLLDDKESGSWKYISYSQALSNIVFLEIVAQDLQWAIFSIMFVIGFLTYHTKSFFLGGFGMLLILSTFPISLVLYRYITQVTFYSSLHNLAVFIVLGIAADDIYVVVDAWNQSETLPELYGKDENETRIKRMSYTYRRSWKTIIVTSSTTSIAFFANLSSSLMPIQAFGIYAGILIMVNYLVFVFYFPALLMFWD